MGKHTFKVGDRVIARGSGFCGYTGTVKRMTHSYVYVEKDRDAFLENWECKIEGDRVRSAHGVWDKKTYLEHIRVITQKTIMAKLSNIAKGALDADYRKMIKAGILDSDLTLTGEGRDIILGHYLSTNKIAFGKIAKGILEEQTEKDY